MITQTVLKIELIVDNTANQWQKALPLSLCISHLTITSELWWILGPLSFITALYSL